MMVLFSIVCGDLLFDDLFFVILLFWKEGFDWLFLFDGVSYYCLVFDGS